MQDILIVLAIFVLIRVTGIIFPNGRGMEPKTPRERFNRIHSSIRNVIERSFGLLKMKWQILYKMPPYPMYKQKMIVVATMVLHNFIREYDGVDLDFARFDRDPMDNYFYSNYGFV